MAGCTPSSTHMRARPAPAQPTPPTVPNASSTQKRARRPAPPTATTPTAVPDWSSLAPDLVRRIGDCILANDDIDYYMDFRVVCHNWSCAIKEEPAGKADRDDPSCFLPSKWTMLDRNNDDIITLVNMETGRFIRKRIPLLRDYFFIGASSGGLVLLGKRAYPYQARVLNPFTGSIDHFKAPVPVAQAKEVVMTASPQTMMVFISTQDGFDGGAIMWADQNSECFHRCSTPFPDDFMCMVLFARDVYLTNRLGSVLSPTAAANQGRRRSARTVSMATLGPASVEAGRYFYLVESRGELLLVTRPWYGVPEQLSIHRVDTVRKVLEPVRTIDNRALFLGNIRCLSVDADKFPAVEGGCIYFVDHVITEIGNFEGSFVATVRFPDEAQQPMLDISPIPNGLHPFTLTHVFANYCKCIHYTELSRQMIDSDDEGFSDDYESDEEDSSSDDDGDYETDGGYSDGSDQ